MLIAEAQNVLMFAQVRERKQGRSGVLCVTNFKLSFITADERTKEVSDFYLFCSNYFTLIVFLYFLIIFREMII